MKEEKKGGFQRSKMTDHITDPKKPMRHNLLSNEDRSIYIPLKNFYRGKKLMNLALVSKNAKEFYNRVSLYPSLKKVYIPNEIKKFIGKFDKLLVGEEKEKFARDFDYAYLTACLHMAIDDLSKNDFLDGDAILETGLERLEKVKTHKNIKNLLETL